MLEWLAQIDRAIFLFLNVRAANPVTDLCMPIITSDTLLRIAYAITVILVLWKGNRQLRWTVLVSAITLLLTDQLSANFLKNYFDRPRPCHTLPDINLLVNCGAGFSMPSAHAANAFGQAIVWGSRAKHLIWYLLGIAFVIAISRVFVGVHYPGDILVGGGVGLLVGLITHTAGSRWISPNR